MSIRSCRRGTECCGSGSTAPRRTGGYLTLAGGRSLAAAGDEKRRFYNFIYGGGMHIGLLLEIELRSATDDTRTIDDLMRAVNAEFGGTERVLISVDVRRIARTLVDGDALDSIFDDCDPDAPSEAVLLRQSTLGLD